MTIETGRHIPAYDDSMDRDVLTLDGLAVRIRPARSDDVEELVRFHTNELSETSSYYRFFSAQPHLSDERATEWANADGRKHATLLALHDNTVVAVGLYRYIGIDRAEAAFAVADRLQHLGIATILLEDLAVLAKRAGYSYLVASTLWGNTAMKATFRKSGLDTKSTFSDGINEVVISLADETAMKDHARGRDRVAAAASIRPILQPGHVVVFGASATRQRPGNVALANIRRAFHGTVSVVHPTASEVDGVHVYRRVADIVEPIDLAVIAVPAAAVPQVVDECGAAGVHAAVVLSAGFSETGAVGLQTEMVERARRYGMRIVGPNCFGVANPSIGLDTTFGVNPMSSGSIALASQSGGLGIALLAEVARRGLGISTFVSLGNKADISGNDLLAYWADDRSTKVIVLYLESFGNPRRFASLARSISPQRPIVALKGGRTEAGQRGASSHTAALMTNDSVVDALFSNGGVVRVRTLEELIDVASLFDSQPIPNGNRVAIVGNAGGPLILAADAAEASGLAVPVLSDQLQKSIRALVLDAAATANPVDLLATVTGDQLAAVLDLIGRSNEVDSVVVVTVRVTAEIGPLGVAAHQSGLALPVIVAEMGEAPDRTAPGSFSSPERAVHALSRVLEYADWRRDLGRESDNSARALPTVNVTAARARIEAVVSSGGDWLRAESAFGVLDDLGVSVAPYRYIRTKAELADAITAVGLPVVLKADAIGVIHKSEANALARSVASLDIAITIFDRFEIDFAGRLNGVLVQREVGAGIELIVGASRSERYGALLLVGAGGTAAEVLGDRVTLLAPASPGDIVTALKQLRIAPLLAGYRDHAPVDLWALADLAYRVGLLIGETPALAELDLNPVIASNDGVAAVDVRLRVQKVDDVPTPLRGLRQG
jgi:acetate---CoA ligase (ADP-forming)